MKNTQVAWIIATIIIVGIIIAVSVSKKEPASEYVSPYTGPAVVVPAEPSYASNAEEDCWSGGGTWIASNGTCY